MKNIISIFLILASIGIFFGFLKPSWAEFQALKSDDAKYQDALEKVAILNQTLEKDQASLSSIPSENLTRLDKLIPNNVDNVKLIIDINNIAAEQGLSIRGITIEQPDPNDKSISDYDSIDLSFNVSTSYTRFLELLKALEKSLRLVDITSISFSPGNTGDTYDFEVTLRTYWLK